MTNDALAAAAQHSASGHLDKAAETLHEALRSDDCAHAVRYELGLVEAQRGNLSLAEQLLRAAVTSGGNIYARGLGHILAKAGKVDEAEVWLNRALKSNPKDAWALANLGALYGDQRKLDQAIACMQQALSIQPVFPWARSAFERMSAERDFLSAVRTAYVEFAGRNNLDPDVDTAGAAAIEFPSATLDSQGAHRFLMSIPASMIINDLGAAHLFYREVAGNGYEFALRRFLDMQLRSDDVFIDVGAHWGVHALTAATRWPREVAVLAVEAHPASSERLRQWVERNDLESDIEVIPKAIGDRDGIARIELNASSMGHRLGATGMEVAMTTLDTILADRDWLRYRRILMKIDIEGYEMEALAGATRLFSACEIAAVIWELGEFHEQAVRDDRRTATLSYLTHRGFEHFRFADENVGGPLIPLDGSERQCNVYSLALNLPRHERYA